MSNSKNTLICPHCGAENDSVLSLGNCIVEITPFNNSVEQFSPFDYNNRTGYCPECLEVIDISEFTKEM